MNKILKNILLFIAIIVLSYSVHNILYFFGISFTTYAIYVIWFAAIGIFYLVLPSNYTLFGA